MAGLRVWGGQLGVLAPWGAITIAAPGPPWAPTSICDTGVNCNNNLKTSGSCVLKASAIECRSIPSIDISIDRRSTPDRHSIDTRSTFLSTVGRQSTDFRRHAVECRSILAVITRSVSVDTQPTYRSLPYDRLSVACR